MRAMPQSTRRIGAHLPLGAGMVKAANRAAEIGADALQVFSDNPTAWRRRSSLPAELPGFRARLAHLGIAPLAIHASYLVNLAGPDEEFFERSIGVLSHELRTAAAYGARFVNVHIGSHRGRGFEAGVARVAEAVDRTFLAAGDDASPDTRLVLENSAGGGFGIGATVEELAEILEAIAGRGVPTSRVGICLDAAHLWGAGYRISEPDEVDALVASFDARIGLERLAMIHLNDSRSELGSHTDRHQHVGAGRIGPVGLARLLVHPALEHVTSFIETPGMDEGYDAVNLDRARRLIAGLPLPELRPEELEMPGSRSRTAPAPSPEDAAEAEEDDRRRPKRRRAVTPAAPPPETAKRRRRSTAPQAVTGMGEGS
jgi:deoxyribonuclease-4